MEKKPEERKEKERAYKREYSRKYYHTLKESQDEHQKKVFEVWRINNAIAGLKYREKKRLETTPIPKKTYISKYGDTEKRDKVKEDLKKEIKEEGKRKLKKKD